MQNVNVIHNKNLDELKASAKEDLVSAIELYKNNPVLLLLSGGSAFDLLDSKLANSLNSNITIGVLDERFSTDPAINNFSQLRQTEFFKQAIASGARFIDTSVTSLDTIEELENRFTLQIRSWIDENAESKIIITQGFGNDAHTSGIMPFSEDEAKFNGLFDSDKLIVSYDAGTKNKYPLRVTTTLTFLRNYVTHSVGYATGDKKEALYKIFNSNLKIHQAPGRVIFDMQGVNLYTDIEF